ncbi:MAG: hypothetical protein H7Y03_05310 [Chitinophagaceae bacterium]|nr:hypothetical protein [Chitinophagaceae bacterium]
MNRRTVLIAGILMGISATMFGQSEKYANVMKANISQLDSALEKGTILNLGNTFERIGDAEKTQWLPYYYASYCIVMHSYMEQDKSKTDGLADRAEALLTKAEALNGGENSETCVIRSMIASSHLMVDPQSRFMKYGQASGTQIAKAKALDPLNPRPVYLEAQGKFYTPEQFGGGKAQAKVLFEKALAMFDTFKPATELSPSWGKVSTLFFLEQIK